MEKNLSQIIHTLYTIDVEPQVSRPAPEFGDYATNVALQLAKQVGKNPREIAEEIAHELRTTMDDIESVEVAGPGFLNVRLSQSGKLRQLHRQPIQGRVGQSTVIETNNPNPFKAMHIGHAMNAIIADTVANLLAVDGAQPRRVSYHGDVGLHVGKSMYSLLGYANGDIEKIKAIAPEDRNTFMSKMYAEGSRAYKEDEAAKAAITQLAEQSFNPGDELYGQVYELCKAWSFEQIDATVARLGNVPTTARFLESLADPLGVKTVKANTPGVFELSDGAYIFRGSKYGSFDNVFVSSSGRGLYGARDLGLMEMKNELFQPEKSYIVTGGEQAQYFKGVIAAAGLVDEAMKDQTVNIPTGLVKLTTGKMSSRDGDVIEIGWLFDQFREAIADRGGEPTEEIITGALRYQFLKVKIGSDIVFDISDAVSLTGNTGSYLQYAHARARRILENTSAAVAMPEVVHEEDEALVRKLGEYSDVVTLAMRTLEPHHICNYLFELAQEFNRYYEVNRVVGDEKEAHRVGLVSVYADVLKAGLYILGIHAPEKM